MRRALSIDAWTVVLVANSAALRVPFSTYLVGRAIELHSALNLADAREMLATLRPDVTILDADTEDDRGLDLIPDIRKVGSQFFVISAKGDVQDRIRALTLGAADFLVKPVDLEELFLRLRNILVNRQPQGDVGSGIFNIHGIEVDMLTRSLLNKDGRPGPELTGAEFVLLRVLGKSLNRIVSRVDLFKACKSGVYVKESRVVDTSISRLRLKFDSTDIGAKILSVRDAGYVLNFEAKAEPGIEPVPGLNANSDVGDLKGTTQKGRVVVKRFGSSEPTSRA